MAASGRQEGHSASLSAQRGRALDCAGWQPRDGGSPRPAAEDRMLGRAGGGDRLKYRCQLSKLMLPVRRAGGADCNGQSVPRVAARRRIKVDDGPTRPQHPAAGVLPQL